MDWRGKRRAGTEQRNANRCAAEGLNEGEMFDATRIVQMLTDERPRRRSEDGGARETSGQNGATDDMDEHVRGVGGG